MEAKIVTTAERIAHYNRRHPYPHQAFDRALHRIVCEREWPNEAALAALEKVELR